MQYFLLRFFARQYQCIVFDSILLSCAEEIFSTALPFTFRYQIRLRNPFLTSVLKSFPQELSAASRVNTSAIPQGGLQIKLVSLLT